MTPSSRAPDFVVATPGRSVCDDNARALQRRGALRFVALGTRRGARDIPADRTRLNPRIGLAAYIAARTLSTTAAESFRFRLHPWFDRWVLKQLQPGDHIISSYGYANACFRRVRERGGKTFLDAGNSHPENYWNILAEEHRRWNIPDPPIARHHYERSKAMMGDVDYVLSPSTFVTRSFLERAFKPAQILKNVYPVDLSCFKPSEVSREKNRPLTIVSTGALSLRKGTPYLLDAFRLIHQRHPSTRFRLTRIVHDNLLPILARYQDLPIDWAPALPHPQLADRLRTSDIFVLPSLEEGLARTALEAMSCGLPVILSPNTGVADYVRPGANGEIVPIRDAAAIVDAVLKWSDRVLSGEAIPTSAFDRSAFSFEAFEKDFLGQLSGLGLI